MAISTSSCILPIYFNKQDSEENEAGKSGYGFDNSTLANSTLVQPGFGDVHKKSSTAPNLPKITAGPTGQLTRINSGKVSSACDLQNPRKNLEMQGISKKSSKLVTGARRQVTISNYESAWEEWCVWCGEQKVDNVRCCINYVLDFLVWLFGMGFEYSTIDSHRSPISVYHN